MSKRNSGITMHFPDLITACRAFAVLAGCILLAGLPSCGQKLPHITPPEPNYLYPDMDLEFEHYKSSLTVSAEIPVAELERLINKELSGLLYEDNSYEDDNNDNFKAKVWKDGLIKVQALGNHFLFDIPLKIWASAGYKFKPFGYTLEGYRDTEFKMRIWLISEVSFSPDWHLVTKTRIDSYDWVTEPTISVAGFSLPIKGMVSRLLNRNADKITKAIDEQVRENFQIRDQVEKTWIIAQEPQLLSEEFHTWLVTTPETIEARLPDARDGMMNIQVSIKGSTQTIISRISPVRSKIVKLPPLKIVDNLPQFFQVGLVSSIGYQDASQMAEEYFKGKTFDFSGGRYKIRIKKINLYGQNESLIIHASLSGSINGDIYLRGIPRYDPESRSVHLDDLQYDLNTRNVLIKAANWLLHGKLLKMMREAMVFPIGEQLDSLVDTLRGTLSSYAVADGIVLKGTLDQATPDKVYLTPEKMYTVIQASGKLDLHVEKLSY